MTWDRRGHAFGSDVALDHADGKIAQLSADSNNQAGKDEIAHAKEWKRESQQPRESHRYAKRAKSPFPGFVRADFAAQWMASENFAERERRNVTQTGRENDEADKAVGVARVRHKSEMPEHPAHIDESDNRQRHSLQFSA